MALRDIFRRPTIVPFVRPDKAVHALFNKRPGHDAGYDLYSLESRILWPYLPVTVDLNVRMLIPSGYFGRITGRSGLNKKGIVVVPGTVDSGYTGIIKATVINLTPIPRLLRRGQRIAQLIIIPFLAPEFQEVESLPETERNDLGFGSSGI